MPDARDAETNFPAGIVPPIEVGAPDDVMEVTALPDYRLAVRFYDGTEGIVYMAEMIASPAAGVFTALRDPTVFAAVRVELGAVIWPGNLDLAPDPMHDELARCGEWRLR